MVDNRSTGFMIGAFSFKSGDASSANAMTDEKQGQGGEYFAQDTQGEEENFKQSEFVDRSAQLKGSLDSLAVLNVANIAHVKKENEKKKEEIEKERLMKVLKRKNKKIIGHLMDDYEKK